MARPYVPSMIVREIRARSILSPSRIYGVNYAANPYTGCGHGCAYCYARFTFLRMNLDPTDWGTIVMPKINAGSLIRREVLSKKRGIVLLSSVTDPYQWLERKYMLTRSIVEVLARRGWPIVVLTKSDLVLRDLDTVSYTHLTLPTTERV